MIQFYARVLIVARAISEEFLVNETFIDKFNQVFHFKFHVVMQKLHNACNCTHLIMNSKYFPRSFRFNKLNHVPNLKQCRELRLLNLESNGIMSLHNQPFQNMEQLHDLLISYNQIETIPHDTFAGLKKLQTLYVAY